MFESSREEKQKGLGKYSKLNITEPKLVNSGYGVTIIKELLTSGLMSDLNDANLSVIS